MDEKTNGKKPLPAVKVNGRRQTRVVTKGERQSSNKKNQKHDSGREQEHLISEDGNVEVVCCGRREIEPIAQKDTKKRLALKIKLEEVPSDNGENSLQLPREKDYDAISPNCTRSSKKKKDSTNDQSFGISPSSKLETVSRTDATSQKPSKVKSFGPEVTNENEDGKRSSKSPGRKKGLVQEAIFRKSAPSSPIAGERFSHSPTQGNKTNKAIKPSSARRRGFACESKNEDKDSTEKRREALCSTTDQFSSERRVVRILRKKF